MENANIPDIVTRGAEELGISLPPGAADAFRQYSLFLEEQGLKMNLTAIKDDADVKRLHFLDSLALLGVTEFTGETVIDIGSGAGFPGVPLKIAEPSMTLTLLDATGKRVAFLEALCEKLGINASCIHARAEEAAHKLEMRERYGIAVSRAVARLDVLCELCLPFVRVGGVFIAMKGIDAAEEVKQSQSAIKILGGKLEKTIDYTIPGTDITHRAIVIAKEHKTQLDYPRRFAKIKKSPL